MQQDASPQTSPRDGSSDAARPTPAIPHYELVRRIGAGGYGEVWLARHSMLGTYRALKVVYRDRFPDAHPFERELKGIRNFEPVSHSHPSQIIVWEVGQDADGRFFYYALELADDQRTGQEIDPASYIPKTLRSELKARGRLPAEECLQLGLAMSTALEHLHRAGLIHRDIKPSNVIFVHGQPKLADIGLVAEEEEGCSFVGTEGYVPPEGPGNRQADVYALGKVLYEMMTGLSPKGNDTSLSPELRYPSLPQGWEQSPDLGPLQELNQVVLKACERDSKRRYRNAAEMEADLVLIGAGGSAVREQKLKQTVRRLKFIAAWVGLALVLSVIIFGVWLYRGRQDLRDLLLGQARLQRQSSHVAGWFHTNWALLERAARIHSGPEILEQAAGALTGVEAERTCVLSNTAGGSAAFADDGRLLVGGAMGTPALIVAANGAKTECSLRVEGPVAWTAAGLPVQFSAASNVCLLQEVTAGRVLQRFPLEPGERPNRTVRPVLAMSPNAQRVAAAVHSGSRARVLAWDTSGPLLGQAPRSARALAFSPDGALLAAGDARGNIAGYTLPGMVKVFDLPPPERPIAVHCLALGRDALVRDTSTTLTSPATGWLLAASYKGGEVIIWDLGTQRRRAVCRGSIWSVTALAFHPDNLTLMSAGRDDEVRFWDVVTGELTFIIDRAGASDARALTFNRAGTRLAWATEAKPPSADSPFWRFNPQDTLEEFPRIAGLAPSVAVWNLRCDRGIHLLRGLAGPTPGIWFSRDSRLVAAISADWHVAVWDWHDDRLVNLFETPTGIFADNAGVAFDAKGRRLAFATGTEARLYELGSGRVLEAWHLPKAGMMDRLQFNAGGRLLFIRRGLDTEPENLRRWRLYELAPQRPPQLLREQAESDWVPFDVEFAPGGERFFVTTRDVAKQRAAIYAYDVASGRKLWQRTVPGLETAEVVIDPTGRWFGYELDQTGRLGIFRLSDFRESGISPAHGVRISPSGDLFAVGDHRGFMLCDRRGSAHGLPLGADWSRYTGTQFSPDGKLFAMGTQRGIVFVADLEEVRRRLAALQP